MPEEHESAPPSEDTPQVDTPVSQEDTGEETGVVDYRSRYENLLPEYTRKSQRLAELEREHQASDEPQYDDDEEPYYEVEEYDPAELRRLARQEAEAVIAARERQQADQQAEIAFVNAEIQTLEKELGENFSDAEWDYLGRTSEDLRDEHGRPDVRRAYEHFNAVLEGRKQKWTSGKRSAKPASGPGAAEVVDLDDPLQQADYIDRIMAANVDDD